MGVKGQALARFGSSCYMNPLSTKMDDSVQLEVYIILLVLVEACWGLPATRILGRGCFTQLNTLL